MSTTSQDARSQRDAIQRAAAARGDRVTRWFSEKRSGASLDRPALAELRAAARAGELGRVYVFRVDRFTRRGIADTFSIVEELRRAGCELVNVADGFDFSGPMGDVVLAVMAWAAEQERNALRERLRAARARVEAAGGKWGRPRRMCAMDVAKARKLQAAGASLRELAQRLRVPRATLHEALKRAG